MQLIRSVTLLASLLTLAPASVVDAGAAKEEHRPRKKHAGRHGRSALRRGEGSDGASLGHALDAAIKHDVSEWVSKSGMLHLEAAEVETEAATDIQKQEVLNKREEHQELAAREGAEKAQVESEAARDWEAVARAAEAEALRLKQDAAVEVNQRDAVAAGAQELRAAAPAAPGPAPGPAPVDFSWAYDMDQGKPAPEQGFEGKQVLHVQGDTMTSDWQGETAVDAGRELCKVCARHPENSWCLGKCRTGEAASPPVTEAVDAGEPPAPSASSAPQPSGGGGAAVEKQHKKEKSGWFLDPLFVEGDGIIGKEGAIADTLKGIFGGAGSGAASRGALAALLPVALVLVAQ